MKSDFSREIPWPPPALRNLRLLNLFLRNLLLPVIALWLFAIKPIQGFAQAVAERTPEPRFSMDEGDWIGYHRVRTNAEGMILPWSHDEPGKAYAHVIGLVWQFWDGMRTDLNGLPYYMNHQVWKPGENDPRGIGGDQLQMALSSWRLLYMFTGQERICENMKFMADHYLSHALSPANAAWPHLPYPYNTLVYSGGYDGDMVHGLHITQPDKAGSLGYELVKLYELENHRWYGQATNRRYLYAAIRIANTLSGKMMKGDASHSPLPFKVNAMTGETVKLHASDLSGKQSLESSYTTNWTGTMNLFLELIRLKEGRVGDYHQALEIFVRWFRAFPLQNNRWGPFFEDVPGWSDTQINAVECARFMIQHPEFFPDWKREVKGIFDWVYKTLGNEEWQRYGVTVVNEQTSYQTPGNSHTARQAAAELEYMARTGQSDRKAHALRQLNWATYMVDSMGRNRYPRDDIWLTDGYGDYVRHYLRAMAAFPDLAPSDRDHILSSTATIQLADYAWDNDKPGFPYIPRENRDKVLLHYRASDLSGSETIRLTVKPAMVLSGDRKLAETADATAEGYQWKALEKGGVLTVQRKTAQTVTVMK